MKEAFIQNLSKQGFSIMLLCAAVAWFSGRLDSAEEKYNTCVSAHVEELEQQNRELIKVVEKNTEALNQVSISIASKKK